MKIPGKHFWLLLLATAPAISCPAQDSPTLGDVARNTRKQEQAPAAKVVVTEDTLSRQKRLRQHYCLPVYRLPQPPQPCSHVELVVNVPGEAKMGGGYNYFFHYHLQLKNGHDYRVAFWPEDAPDDPGVALEAAKDNFVSTVIYREIESPMTSAAKVLYVEDTAIGDKPALLIRFQGSSDRGPRRGIALFAVVVPGQVVATSCVFLLEDISEAEPACENILRSTQIIVHTDNERVWRSDDGGAP